MHRGLDKNDVFSCFDVFEFDFDIPVGLLRPEDDLSLLTEPPRTANPIDLLFGGIYFRGDDLAEELSIRLKRFGSENDWKSITTFDELVRAWCGLRR